MAFTALILSSSPLGGSTPPGITAPAVPSIPSPIGVNGFTGLPPQANGQPAAEAVFANGIHPYPGMRNHAVGKLSLVSPQPRLLCVSSFCLFVCLGVMFQMGFVAAQCCITLLMDSP